MGVVALILSMFVLVLIVVSVVCVSGSSVIGTIHDE